MSKDRRKELKELYKQTRPEMGILCFHCKPTDVRYLLAVNDVKGKRNSVFFRLQGGGYFCKALQQDWTNHGEESFEITVLDTLGYDKDDPGKTDYTQELSMLLEDWMAKLEGAVRIK